MVGVRGSERVGVGVALGGTGVGEAGKGEGVAVGTGIAVEATGIGVQEISKKSKSPSGTMRCMVTSKDEFENIVREFCKFW